MPVFKTMLAYWRMLFRQRRALRSLCRRQPKARSAHEADGRDRRRRHPRDDRRVSARAGRRRRLALRARARPRRPRRLLRLRRHGRRPLLPRRAPDGRPRDRPRRGARARRPLAVPADQGRLLRRRTALLDDLAEGVPHLSSPPSARARAAGDVRRPLPADEGARRPRRPLRSRSGCGGTAARASSRSCGSRCSTRSSTGASTTSRPPTSGRGRAGWARPATRAGAR